MSTDNGTKPLRGVFYARKSDDDGTDSVEQQEEWARTVPAKENIEILEFFTDHAIRGQDTARRKDFHAMLKFCQEQHKKGMPVDVIVLWNPNRFSRADSHETAWFHWEFRKVGVQRMYSASHGWRDFRKMEHRVLSNIEQDTNYNAYARDLAQVALRGHIRRAKEGRPQGGQVPLGFRLTYELVEYRGKKRKLPCKYVEDPDTSWIVKELFARYLEEQASLATLCDWLTSQNIPVRGRSTTWLPQTVRCILTNQRYLGHALYAQRATGRDFFVVDGVPVAREGKISYTVRERSETIAREYWHDQLIDDETFQRVQEKLARKSPTYDCRRKGRIFRLAGLLYCGHCQAHLCGRFERNRRSAKDPGRFCYICGTYNVSGQCHHNLIQEEPLLRAIANKIKQKLPPLLNDLRQQIRQQVQEENTGDDNAAAAAEREIQRLTAKIETAGRRLATEDERYLPVIRKELDRLQAQLEQAQKALEASVKVPIDVEDAEATIEGTLALVSQLDDVLTNGDASEVRKALHQLITKVEVYFNHAVKGGQTRSTFARALVYFSPEIFPGTQPAITTSRSLPKPWASRRPENGPPISTTFVVPMRPGASASRPSCGPTTRPATS
jgi:hypothetical protein